MKMNKDAYKDFLKKSPITLQLGTILVLFFVLVYVIFYFLSDYLQQLLVSSLLSGGIFSFIFIILLCSLILGILSPFIYSYFASNSVLNSKMKESVTVKNFFRTYAIGNKFPAKGQLKLFITLLWTFLTYIVFIFVVSGITYSIMINFNALGIANKFEELIKLFNNLYYQNSQNNQSGFLSAYNDLMSFINNKDNMYPFTYPMIFINFGGLLAGLYVFFHKINLNVFRYYLATSMGGMTPKYVNIIFKEARKNKELHFYKNYYSTLYPLTLIYILVFSLSYFLLYLIPNITINGLYILSATSTLITASVLVLLMPISFNHYDYMWKKDSSIYLTVFINIATDNLKNMKEAYNFVDNEQQAQLKKAEENLNKLKEELDKDNKTEDKDKTDDNKNE